MSVDEDQNGEANGPSGAGATMNVCAAIRRLEAKLAGKLGRGVLYAHLLGFEDVEGEEPSRALVLPEDSTQEDTYTKALVKMHAAVYTLRAQGHRQAAAALEHLVHKWRKYLAQPPLPSRSNLTRHSRLPCTVQLQSPCLQRATQHPTLRARPSPSLTTTPFCCCCFSCREGTTARPSLCSAGACALPTPCSALLC
jgi:hypothetical protein